MRSVFVGLLGTLALGAAARAEVPPQVELGTPIHRFIDAFDKGDLAGAAANYAPGDVSIIDEVPPYAWRGPGALQAWAADLGRDATANGVTEPRVDIGEPIRWEVTGDAAYVIVPAAYAYKLKGVAMREPAHMTYTLRRTADGWKITGWTWTGPKARPAQDTPPRP